MVRMIFKTDAAGIYFCWFRLSSGHECGRTARWLFRRHAVAGDTMPRAARLFRTKCTMRLGLHIHMYISAYETCVPIIWIHEYRFIRGSVRMYIHM